MPSDRLSAGSFEPLKPAWARHVRTRCMAQRSRFVPAISLHGASQASQVPIGAPPAQVQAECESALTPQSWSCSACASCG
eukprot:1274421-Pyramimonas_sp.AAC.1